MDSSEMDPFLDEMDFETPWEEPAPGGQKSPPPGDNAADEQTRIIAAGLASQDQSDVLAALEAMQKAVIGDAGEKVLVAYVLASPQCAEIMRAWQAGPAAATSVPVLLLLYYMFRLPLSQLEGTARGHKLPGQTAEDLEHRRRVAVVKSRLDKVARSIVRTQMKDVYSHLSSSQRSRHNAALLLLSAIVLRGRSLATEVATSFDFTVAALKKLGRPPKQAIPNKKLSGGNDHGGILKRPTRAAFLELAISFLTVGDPGLLRWILQKRPLWIGVLHGLSKDDDSTIVRVLTMLHKKVMAPACLVPRGLQSVLFGDATLEQLARISADSSLAEAGPLAHSTLLSVCTEPSHGLCPESSEVRDTIAPDHRQSKSGAFGGGQGRLLRLMMHLKVTEVDAHKDVLLATARRTPALARLYLASIPLSLEPRISPAWFNTMSIVSQLIPIASHPTSFSSMVASRVPFAANGPLVQDMCLSLLPSSLSRVVLNRGLLHVDIMVKHACLRVLLEALLCLRRIVNAVDATSSSENESSCEHGSQSEEGYDAVILRLPHSEGVPYQHDGVKASQSLQDMMRASVPDPSTLLAMLSVLIASLNAQAKKKRKRSDSPTEVETPDSGNIVSDIYIYDETIKQLWGPEVSDGGEPKGLLRAKVIQVLAAYQMALPLSMADSGFDAFKLLSDDASSLSIAQQQAICALLLAVTASSPASGETQRFAGSITGYGSAYKRFKQLLLLMMNSEVKQVTDEVYLIIQRVLSSIGAFNSNVQELSLWLDPLWRWKIEKSSTFPSLEGCINLIRDCELQAGDFRAKMVDFLSAVVSNVGQNIYKYLDALHSILAKYTLQDAPVHLSLHHNFVQGVNMFEFGPFVICALEICLQGVIPEGTGPAEHFAVMLYVTSVLKLMLQYQRRPEFLAAVICSLLSNKENKITAEQRNSSEWIVLLRLLHQAQRLIPPGIENAINLGSSVTFQADPECKSRSLSKVLRAHGVSQNSTVDEMLSELTSSLVHSSVEEVVKNFPKLMKYCMAHLKHEFSTVISLLELSRVLPEVSLSWPGIFMDAVELTESVKSSSKEYRWSLGTPEAFIPQLSPTVPDTAGLCILLLISPFSVLFSAATYSNTALLLRSQTFCSLLQGSLWRVHCKDWSSTVRLIVAGMKHILSWSAKGIDTGSALQACFSLLFSLVLPDHQPHGNSFVSSQENCSANTRPAYEHMVIDLLNNPDFYDLFMHPDASGNGSIDSSMCLNNMLQENKDKMFDSSLKRVLESAAAGLHPVDFHILDLLRRLLRISQTTVSTITPNSGDHYSSGFWKKVLNACQPYMLKATESFQKELASITNEGVMASSALFAVTVLILHVEPSSLMNTFLSLLRTWPFKIRSSRRAVAPHVLGLHFVTVFVTSLSNAAPNVIGQREKRPLCSGDVDPKTQPDGLSVYDLYERITDQVIGCPSIMADLCLLSFLQFPDLSHLHLIGFQRSFKWVKTSYSLARSTPLEVLRHCVFHPNKVTGKIALLLADTSLFHLRELGWLLALGTGTRRAIDFSNKSQSLAEKLLTSDSGTQKTELVLSDQDLLHLLPAAHVYIASEFESSDSCSLELASHLACVYAKLLEKRLKTWDMFVSVENEIDGYHNTKLLVSMSEQEHFHYPKFLQHYRCSPLGQVAYMLQSCHVICSLKKKAKSRLLEHLLSKDKVPLLNQNVLLSAGEELCHCVFEAMAKADIIRHLLYSGYDALAKGNCSAEEAERQDARRHPDESLNMNGAAPELSFLHSLVSTLSVLYESKALKAGRGTVGACWIQFLEESLLLHIIEITRQLPRTCFDISGYLPLYRLSLRMFLRYRFGKMLAMKASRYLVLVLLRGFEKEMIADDQQDDADVLELLMAHSKFLPSLLSSDSTKMHIPHISGRQMGKGTALNSLSSVLSLVGTPLVASWKSESDGSAVRPTAMNEKLVRKETDSNAENEGGNPIEPTVEESQLDGGLDEPSRLELVKLIRVLLRVRLKEVCGHRSGGRPAPLDELLFVLLAAYGGTLSAVDLETFGLMREVETHGGLGIGGLSGLDYLWGEAALKRRAKISDAMAIPLDRSESIDELRRQAFKEYLPVDPRRCGLAVLFFPAERKFGVDASVGMSELDESREEVREGNSHSSVGDIEAAAYDPAFLLAFSLHGLSTGCVSAEEFSRLGLLAVAFASMCSAEESMRKAGYEVLAQYLRVLEDGPSFKGRLQIRLLMTNVKNSVTEPWQRIPAVFAVLAAEASCILMHPENHQYPIINRYLLRAPSLDLESVPLFQVMFGSGSVQYRTDRVWMLRLLAAGLHSSVDAHIYRRKFVVQLLMSFHDTAMADAFSKKWILQVIHQAASVRSCAQYLVEHSGLLSWLVSVAVNSTENDSSWKDDGHVQPIAIIALKIIERLMHWRSVQRHFLQSGFDELSKAGCMFHQFLLRTAVPECRHIFRRSTLNIMLTLMRFSQRRKRHQTHFTLSLEGLQQVLYLVAIVASEADVSPKKEMEERELALQLLLHTPPPLVFSHKDKSLMLKVSEWALSVALQSKSNIADGTPSLSDTLRHSLRDGIPSKESFAEKLLRWVAASIILGGLAEGTHEMVSGEVNQSCLSVVDRIKQADEVEGESLGSGTDEKLAALLTTLESSVGGKVDSTTLVPVVAALAMLTKLRSITHDGDQAVGAALQKLHTVLDLFLSELPVPVETNPSWQWSFSSPWTVRNAGNQSAYDSAIQEAYVSDVCQTLLILFNQLLLRQKGHYPQLLLNWEAQLLQTPIDDGVFGKDPIIKMVSMKLKVLQGKLCNALRKGLPDSMDVIAKEGMKL